MNSIYFENLREKINNKLREKPNNYSRIQIEDFPWLYGALGEVPSEVMFICENPSIAGIKKADDLTVDGGPPDIEAQWWGGYAGTRFRPVLCELGLKSNGADDKSSWRPTCNYVSGKTDFNAIFFSLKSMTRSWAG